MCVSVSGMWLGSMFDDYSGRNVLMILRKWEDLPRFMQCEEVREYYDILAKKKLSFKLKRAFDVVAGVCVLIVTAIPMLIIAIKVATESPGGVFYRQERITTYGKKFRIHKFRTMVANADKIGLSMITNLSVTSGFRFGSGILEK